MSDFNKELKSIFAEGRKYRRERRIKERFRDLLFKILFQISDDASMCYETMEDHYNGVPESLKKVSFQFHTFVTFDHDDPKRKEALAWLEGEDEKSD